LNFFFLKKTETGSNRPVLVRFFREKTGSNRFGSVFWVWLGLARFFRFDLVFLVWLGFGSVWLGFFQFFFRFGSVFPVPGLKNRNRTEPVSFFKILIDLIGFFLRFDFFSYFFSDFLGLIGFSVFLNTPTPKHNTPNS
jgi:hypothetical protein